MEMINPFLEIGELVLQTETHEFFNDPVTNSKLENPYNGMFHGVAVPLYIALVRRDINTGEYVRLILVKATSVLIFETDNVSELDNFVIWLKATAYVGNNTDKSPLRTYKEIIEENEFTTTS